MWRLYKQYEQIEKKMSPSNWIRGLAARAWVFYICGHYQVAPLLGSWDVCSMAEGLMWRLVSTILLWHTFYLQNTVRSDRRCPITCPYSIGTRYRKLDCLIYSLPLHQICCVQYHLLLIKTPRYTGDDFMFLYRFVRRRRPQILVHAITFEQLFGFLSF